MASENTTDLFSHVVPVLSGMHAGLQRCGPGCRVHTRALVLGALDRLPVHKQRDGILGVVHAVVRLARGYSCRSARDYPGRDGLVLQDPAADINVVR